jgi:hypothetical protein
MAVILRFSQLSAPRQALVRLFQTLDFGHIVGVVIQNSDPVFHPEPIVLVDVKLDSEEGERQESDLPDFVLRAEVCRLMARFDELKNGRIERIEVRAGIPRRVIIERRVTEEPR